MASAQQPGLRPLEPVYASPETYPGDKCLCCWSVLPHEPPERRWRLKYVNASCPVTGPGGSHARLALSIVRATRKGR